jgi:hypothetical protein
MVEEKREENYDIDGASSNIDDTRVSCWVFSGILMSYQSNLMRDV